VVAPGTPKHFYLPVPASVNKFVLVIALLRLKVLFYPTFYCLAIEIRSFTDNPGLVGLTVLVTSNCDIVTDPK
jgi:hypothetical protein